MSSNGTTLMHITTCRICGQSFSAPPMEVPIIGEPPATKTLRMIQYLQKHVEKKHPRHYATVIGSCNEFGVLLVGLSFDTTDPALLQSREALRYGIHCLTRKMIVDDARIEQLIADAGELTATTAAVLMRDLRDALLEIGKYSPIQPAPPQTEQPIA